MKPDSGSAEPAPHPPAPESQAGQTGDAGGATGAAGDGRPADDAGKSTPAASPPQGWTTVMLASYVGALKKKGRHLVTLRGVVSNPPPAPGSEAGEPAEPVVWDGVWHMGSQRHVRNPFRFTLKPDELQVRAVRGRPRASGRLAPPSARPAALSRIRSPCPRRARRSPASPGRTTTPRWAACGAASSL